MMTEPVPDEPERLYYNVAGVKVTSTAVIFGDAVFHLKDIQSVVTFERVPLDERMPRTMGGKQQMSAVGVVLLFVNLFIFANAKHPKTAALFLLIEITVIVGVLYARWKTGTSRPFIPLVVELRTTYGNVELGSFRNKIMADELAQAITATLNEDRARREARNAAGLYR